MSVVLAQNLGLDSPYKKEDRLAASQSVTLGTRTHGRRRRQPSDAETACQRAPLPHEFFTGAAFPLMFPQRRAALFGSSGWRPIQAVPGATIRLSFKGRAERRHRNSNLFSTFRQNFSGNWGKEGRPSVGALPKASLDMGWGG